MSDYIRIDPPDPDYGGITLTLGKDDGARKILEADDVIGISVIALAVAANEEFRTDPDGNLVILGQLTYRPVRFDQDGRIIICQKVT